MLQHACDMAAITSPCPSICGHHSGALAAVVGAALLHRLCEMATILLDHLHIAVQHLG